MSSDKPRNSRGPLHHWKSYTLPWLHTRESSIRESLPCLSTMRILRFLHHYLSVCIDSIFLLHSNNFVECRTACGFKIELYFSLYIQHLQSHMIWIYLVTAEGSSMAITQTSFVLLKVILMMHIRIICWNGRGIRLNRECWVTSPATTRRCVGAYMSMAMLACMQLVMLKS